MTLGTAYDIRCTSFCKEKWLERSLPLPSCWRLSDIDCSQKSHPVASASDTVKSWLRRNTAFQCRSVKQVAGFSLLMWVSAAEVSLGAVLVRSITGMVADNRISDVSLQRTISYLSTLRCYWVRKWLIECILEGSILITVFFLGGGGDLTCVPVWCRQCLCCASKNAFFTEKCVERSLLHASVNSSLLSSEFLRHFRNEKRAPIHSVDWNRLINFPEKGGRGKDYVI